MSAFSKRFKFQKEKHLFIGVERECFLTREGVIVPIAYEVISQLNNTGCFGKTFGYELSACQLEIRTDPASVETIESTLHESDQLLKNQETKFEFKALHQEVAPYDMSLDVYPDPSGRYQKITREMPTEKLRAACRVAGTHIHIGMGSREKAMQAYNNAIPHLDNLCIMGDKSHGERLRIYRIMAPNFTPPHYDSWGAYEKYALEHGFIGSPRNCWHLIRISIHGTIEFRMFGATSDINEITRWAKYCHSICKNAF